MKAFQINKYGDNSVVENVNIEIPSLTPNQVLVKNRAISINPVDYKIRNGYFAAFVPRTFPFTLGWEASGIVEQIGEEVTQYKPGDQVMVIPNFGQGGTYAEYVVVNENEVLPKPEDLSFEQAAMFPYSAATAYTALIPDANAQAGEKILILGAGGSVGQMATQIAKNFGLDVTGMATGENIEELQNLNIDRVIDYTKEDFSQSIKDLDIILDLVGGETLEKSYPLLKEGGRLISTTQNPDESALARNKAHGKMTQAAPNIEMMKILNQWLKEDKIKIKEPTIFPLDEAKEALAQVENRKTKNKIVLKNGE